MEEKLEKNELEKEVKGTTTKKQKPATTVLLTLFLGFLILVAIAAAFCIFKFI